MSTEVEERSRTERAFVDPSGAVVETREQAFPEPQAVAVTTRLTLHNSGVTFEIEAQINPNTYPFQLTGGRITSGICGAPWDITGGYYGDDLRLDARRTGDGSCAQTITVVGEYVHPGAYRGTYGFNGASGSFRHTTLYQP
jgi:hypothetical protein